MADNHDLTANDTVAGNFFQPTAATPTEHSARLAALVQEMFNLDRVVILTRDPDGSEYVVSHHPERITLRPRNGGKRRD
jgi:lauroyl/myristoyl acyltransferase